jgi:site-specific recombinase XerD
MVSARRVRQPRPQSCLDCQAWGFAQLCPGCRGFRDRPHRFPLQRCDRCGTPQVPCWEGLCRGCCLDLSHNPASAPEQPWRQLSLGKPYTFNLTIHWVQLCIPQHERRWAQSPPAIATPSHPVSPHLLAPGQQPLLHLPRDWTAIGSLPIEELPALTPAAEQLIDDFQAYMHDQHWGAGPEKSSLRAIRVLVSWLGAEAPIPEDDIRTLSATERRARGKRLIQFLATRNMLVPSPRSDRDERKINSLIEAHPRTLAAELRAWVTVLRGEGRKRHRPTSWGTICRYMYCLTPVITTWSTRIDSFREVTDDDIKTVLQAHKGSRPATVHVALRSLFRALKQERLIFSDPTTGFTAPKPGSIPKPLASNQLQGIIDRAHTPAAKFVVVLVALHGMGSQDVTRLLASNLNLSNGRLITMRGGLSHTIYLDELTHAIATEWLRERHRRWPTCTNPHLIVTQNTAADTAGPPMHRTTINRIFKNLGLNPQQVRIDRIYHEAQVTADPIHLMRLFGISASTAMRYVQTAHPERTARLPR